MMIHPGPPIIESNSPGYPSLMPGLTPCLVDAFQIICQNHPLMIQDRQQALVEQPAPPAGQNNRIPTQRPASDALVGVSNLVENHIRRFLGFFFAGVAPPGAFKDAS